MAKCFFFFSLWAGQIEKAEVLQLARRQTNRQRQTGRARTQSESFRTDLGLIVVRKLVCWFEDKKAGYTRSIIKDSIKE